MQELRRKRCTEALPGQLVARVCRAPELCLAAGEPNGQHHGRTWTSLERSGARVFLHPVGTEKNT